MSSHSDLDKAIISSRQKEAYTTATSQIVNYHPQGFIDSAKLPSHPDKIIVGQLNSILALTLQNQEQIIDDFTLLEDRVQSLAKAQSEANEELLNQVVQSENTLKALIKGPLNVQPISSIPPGFQESLQRIEQTLSLIPKDQVLFDQSQIVTRT